MGPVRSCATGRAILRDQGERGLWLRRVCKSVRFQRHQKNAHNVIGGPDRVEHSAHIAGPKTTFPAKQILGGRLLKQALQSQVSAAFPWPWPPRQVSRATLPSHFHQNPISSPVRQPGLKLYLSYYWFSLPMMDESQSDSLRLSIRLPRLKRTNGRRPPTQPPFPVASAAPSSHSCIAPSLLSRSKAPNTAIHLAEKNIIYFVLPW